MDKGASDKEKMNQPDAKLRSRLSKTVDPKEIDDVSHILDDLDKVNEMVINSIHNDEQAMFSGKKAFPRLEEIMGLIHIVSREAIISNFALRYTRRRLSILEKILGEITEKLNIELPNVKAEMQSLKKTIASDEFNTISQFVKQIQEQVTAYKKKMEENDLAE